MSQIDEVDGEVKCTTTGNVTNDLVIRCGIHWCGKIENGVAFRFGERGAWVLAYEDLKAAYELATAIREKFSDAAQGKE